MADVSTVTVQQTQYGEPRTWHIDVGREEPYKDSEVTINVQVSQVNGESVLVPMTPEEAATLAGLLAVDQRCGNCDSYRDGHCGRGNQMGPHAGDGESADWGCVDWKRCS